MENNTEEFSELVWSKDQVLDAMHLIDDRLWKSERDWVSYVSSVNEFAFGSHPIEFTWEPNPNKQVEGYIKNRESMEWVLVSIEELSKLVDFYKALWIKQTEILLQGDLFFSRTKYESDAYSCYWFCKMRFPKKDLQ